MVLLAFIMVSSGSHGLTDSFSENTPSESSFTVAASLEKKDSFCPGENITVEVILITNSFSPNVTGFSEILLSATIGIRMGLFEDSGLRGGEDITTEGGRPSGNITLQVPDDYDETTIILYYGVSFTENRGDNATGYKVITQFNHAIILSNKDYSVFASRFSFVLSSIFLTAIVLQYKRVKGRE